MDKIIKLTFTLNKNSKKLNRIPAENEKKTTCSLSSRAPFTPRSHLARHPHTNLPPNKPLRQGYQTTVLPTAVMLLVVAVQQTHTVKWIKMWIKILIVTGLLLHFYFIWVPLNNSKNPCNWNMAENNGEISGASLVKATNVQRLFWGNRG